MATRWMSKSPYALLTGYYLIVMAVIYALIIALPALELESAFTMERLAALSGGGFGGGAVGVEATQPRDPLETAIQALTAIIGR